MIKPTLDVRMMFLMRIPVLTLYKTNKGIVISFTLLLLLVHVYPPLDANCWTIRTICIAISTSCFEKSATAQKFSSDTMFL